ncbi:ion transporter [bacterium]|nr:ion transporter [bacterium]
MFIHSRLNRLFFKPGTSSTFIFDLVSMLFILLSVVIVCLSSVDSIYVQYGYFLDVCEWIFTILFTLEYLLRLFATPQPKRYARSFFGIVDFVSIAPSYLSLFFPSGQYLVIIRILRVMRVFRILKLFKYVSEMQLILDTLVRSSRKITVFVLMVLILVTFLGSVMYLIEGEKHGFSNIPVSIYWAIVTLTTVGYGDISPQTGFGKFISSIIMVLGYCIIAVPTGLVSVDISHSLKSHKEETPSIKIEDLSEQTVEIK